MDSSMTATFDALTCFNTWQDPENSFVNGCFQGLVGAFKIGHLRILLTSILLWATLFFGKNVTRWTKPSCYGLLCQNGWSNKLTEKDCVSFRSGHRTLLKQPVMVRVTVFKKPTCVQPNPYRNLKTPSFPKKISKEKPRNTKQKLDVPGS